MLEKSTGLPLYPWSKWFKLKVGSPVRQKTLIRGVHFDCMPHSMAQQVRNAAYKRGRRVSIQIEEDCLKITIRRKKKLHA